MAFSIVNGVKRMIIKSGEVADYLLMPDSGYLKRELEVLKAKKATNLEQGNLVEVVWPKNFKTLCKKHQLQFSKTLFKNTIK